MINSRNTDTVIVAYGRSAVGKAVKGAFHDMHTVDYAYQVLKGVLDRVPQLDPALIEDVIVGCARPENEQGMNIARLITLRAGLPYDVAAQTVNRYCSSGLQSISTAANMIMTGQSEVMMAGGVETMRKDTMTFHPEFIDQTLAAAVPGAYMPMGITAENVAEQFHVTREEMDIFSAESHRRAIAAIKAGKFKKEIVPVQVSVGDGKATTFEVDECPRAGTTVEGLASLKPVFREGGAITAGNSSQMSDGCGFVVLMSAEKAKELNIKPVARFVGFAVAGVDPTIMGIGPMKAVPKLMKLSRLKISDMDVIELNEAFASQSIVCIRELDFDRDKVNPNGGAIAMGHPLGATGAILTCKILSELERTGGRYGLVTMCIGGGMGAAGILERL